MNEYICDECGTVGGCCSCKKNDNIKKPAHYTYGKYEVVDVIMDWGLDWCRSNAIKYVARAGRKGDFDEDIQKAIEYLQILLKHRAKGE